MARIAEHLKMSAAEIDDLMSRERHVRIATLGPGSGINLTPMTFGWAGRQAYIFARGQKIANLRRRPEATLLVDTGERWRELQGVMMSGGQWSQSSLDCVLARTVCFLGQCAARKCAGVNPYGTDDCRCLC